MRGGVIFAVAAAVSALAPMAAAAQPDIDNAVDARIRSSAAAAQALQGPLDGAWTLVSAAGTPILAFELVDKPGGQGAVEGVWRDLRKASTPGDIGLIDQIARTPTALTITLNAAPGQSAMVISLRPDPTGAWSGELKDGGATTQVKLRRN
ncbi:MAG TPA: hypothetical protein VN694_06515 [Caulobacteraceae bacterium]|nr:hypothetical protein [Caulobacteraceae bacterium]